MDKLLLEREVNDHKGRETFRSVAEKNHRSALSLVPFTPQQPIESLKVGDIYLKSIDKSHRRQYEKYAGQNEQERNHDNEPTIEELYVSRESIMIG